MGDTRLTTPRPGTFTATLILFGPILVAACGNPGMVDSGTGAAPNVDARSADAAVETGLIDATAADALDATGVTGRDTAPTDTGSGDAGPSLVDAAPVTDTMPVADGGPPASAIYVSTTGDDRNVGTRALPVRSIARALAIRAPADEIRVLGGVYNAPVRVSVSGTATRRIRILAVDGARPVLDTMRVASARPLELAGSFIDVEGFEIRGGAAQCIDAAGSDLALRNLVVHDCVSHGIMIRGARIRADGNTIYDTVRENAGGMASGWGSALKVQVGASDVTLTRNRVYHNWGEGIAITRGFDVVVRENWSYDNFSVNIYIDNSYRVLVEKNLITCVVNSGYERAGEPATAIQIGEELYAGWGAQLHDVTIQNNIAAFCRRGIAFYASDVGGGLIRVKVHYNTLWGSTNTALSIAYAAPTRETVVSNNLIQQPTGRLAFVERLDGITLGNNYWVGTPPANASTASDRMGDPRLMSVPARNAISFRLAADSPARDGAAELPSPRDDLDGVTRHAASSLRSDMGALEYVAGATPSAFDAIFR